MCFDYLCRLQHDMITLHDKTFELFISEEEIAFAVEQLAKKIADDFADEVPVFVGVLNGAFMFMAELLKHYPHLCEVAFVQVQSYQGTESSGTVTNLSGLPQNLEGKSVILVEDIVDTGNTIAYLKQEFKALPIKKLKIATLFLKPEAYQKDIRLDYVAIRIPNRFIVGYGLDYNGLGRNLQHMYQLADEN